MAMFNNQMVNQVIDHCDWSQLHMGQTWELGLFSPGCYGLVRMRQEKNAEMTVWPMKDLCACKKWSFPAECGLNSPWAIAAELTQLGSYFFWLSDTSWSWCLVGYPGLSKIKTSFCVREKNKESKLVGLAFGLPEHPRFPTGVCASVDPGNMKPTDKMKNKQVGGPTPWIRKTYSKSNTSSKSDFVSWDQ